MVFVPVPTPPPAPLSPRSRELAERLARTLEDYQRQHPELSPEEVARAVNVLRAASTGSAARRRAGVLAGTLAGAGVAVFVVLAANGGRFPGLPGLGWAEVALMTGVVGLFLLFKVRRAGED